MRRPFDGSLARGMMDRLTAPSSRNLLLRVSLAATLFGAGCEGFCGAPKPTVPPEQQTPTVKGPDGKEYILLARGAHKPVFDAQGRLDRVEYDRNGDGKPDQIARHNGARVPEIVENDDDFDGTPDRWLYYNPSGVLVKIGSARKGQKPDFWTYTGPDGKPTRQEFDDDGDGQADRTEAVGATGRVETVVVDSDRDGKPDRWQHWEKGRLQYEDLDTNGDQKPDKRLRYGAKGEVLALEPLK